jgi:predicted MPP superfamily phosphohydrolase
LIKQSLIEAGVRVLTNETNRPNKDLPLLLVGVGDIHYHEYKPEKALKELEQSQEGTYRVVLSHNPDTASTVKNWPVDLQVSGHSHGGQICVPWYSDGKWTSIPVLSLLAPIYRSIPSFMRVSHYLFDVSNICSGEC